MVDEALSEGLLGRDAEGAGAGAAPERKAIDGDMTLDEAIDAIGFGKFQVYLVLILSIGAAAVASESILLSFLSPCLSASWNLKDEDIATLSAIVFTGTICGALFWGPVADAYGRKPVFIFAGFLITIFGVISSFAPNFAWMLVMRFLVGVGIGAAAIPFDMCAEFMPAEYRGKALMVTGVFFGLGATYVSSVAWLTLEGDHDWQSLMIVCAVPMCLAVIGVFWIPESPRWLLEQGMTDKATAVVRHAAEVNGKPIGANFKVLATCGAAAAGGGEAPRLAGDEEKQAAVELRGGNAAERLLPYMEVFSEKYRSITLWLILLWVLFGFSYVGMVLLIPLVFGGDKESQSNDLHVCDFDFLFILLSSIAEFFGNLAVVFIIDHPQFGRKTSQALLYGFSAIFMFFLGFPGAPQWVLGTSAFVSRALFSAGSAVSWVHTPECYPTRIRSTAHGLFFLVHLLGAAMGAYWVYLTRDIVTAVGLSFSAVLCAAIPMFLPETRQIHLDSKLPSPSVQSGSGQL